MEHRNTAIDEMRIIGREISGRTFSGKKLDYKIPEILDVNTSYDKIKNNIMEYLDQFDDIALLLSGGKDSRLLACILKAMGKKVKCYTYITRYNKYERNELKVAQNVAHKLGFEHETISWHWDEYYDFSKIYNIVSKTDGVPLFHTLLTMAHVRPQIPEHNLITGDLITELWDTMEYRPKIDKSTLKGTLYRREHVITRTPEDAKIVGQLKRLYLDTDNKTLLLILKSDRLIRKQVYDKLKWNVIHPALDAKTLCSVLSLDMKDRTDGNLMRRLIKKINPELYKYRTARSPLSLRFPLSYHIAYSRVMKASVSTTSIPGGHDYEVRRIKNKHERYREDNYRWWNTVKKGIKC